MNRIAIVGKPVKGLFVLLAVSLAAMAAAGDEEMEATNGEERAYLGVYVESVPALASSQLGLGEGMGVVVEGVIKGSPAEKAGLAKHDILLKFDDQLLIGTKQIVVLVRNSDIGSSHEITLLRRGKEQTVSVEIGSKAYTEKNKKPEAQSGWLPAAPMAPDSPKAPHVAFFDSQSFRELHDEDGNFTFINARPEEIVHRMEANEEIEMLMRKMNNADLDVKMPTFIFKGNEHVFDFSDEKGNRFIIVDKDGERRLTVISSEGEEKYAGVLDEEAKMLLPEHLREKLPKIQEVVEVRTAVAPRWVARDKPESF